MNTRVPFLQWKKPLCVVLTLLVLAIVGGIIFGLLSSHPFETILVVAVVIIGMTMAGIINKTTDDLEQAQNWSKPVGPDEVLSFSLEKEMREEKNK